MSQYFISFLSNGQISQDDEGQDLPGLEEAAEAARVSAREILADNIKSNSTRILEAVIITNERGDLLMTIPAADVLPKPLRG